MNGVRPEQAFFLPVMKLLKNDGKRSSTLLRREEFVEFEKYFSVPRSLLYDMPHASLEKRYQMSDNSASRLCCNKDDAESTPSCILSTFPLDLKKQLADWVHSIFSNSWVHITKYSTLSTEYLFRGLNVCSATLIFVIYNLFFIYVTEILHYLLNLNFESS